MAIYSGTNAFDAIGAAATAQALSIPLAQKGAANGVATLGATGHLSSSQLPEGNNFTATTDPTVNSDSAHGYAVGSLWVNTTTSALFVCLNATATAAVWRRISSAV